MIAVHILMDLLRFKFVFFFLQIDFFEFIEHFLHWNFFLENKYFYMKKPTVSGPVTFVGGGIERNVFRSSGPGLLRDKRLRA